MKTKTTLLIVILFAASRLFSQNFADSVFVLTPCKGNSIINEHTTETDLIKFFGKKNITRQTRDYAEGTETYNCTIIFADSPNELVVKWKEGKDYVEPEFLDLWGKKTRWKLDNGITLGTPLNELVKLNGADFTFSGLGWDYGGIPTFGKGKLNTQCYSLRIDGEPIGKWNDKDYKKISGDGVTVSTKSDIVKKFKLKVSNIMVLLN